MLSQYIMIFFFFFFFNTTPVYMIYDDYSVVPGAAVSLFSNKKIVGRNMKISSSLSLIKTNCMKLKISYYCLVQ